MKQIIVEAHRRIDYVAPRVLIIRRDDETKTNEVLNAAGEWEKIELSDMIKDGWVHAVTVI